MELKPAGKSGKVKAQIGETMLLSRYVAEARRAAKDAENSAQHAETVLINKQDKLVSGVNIKTINDQDVLGSGNIVISGNGSSIAIDSKLSDTSVNAVQNRVITGAVRKIERALNAPPPIGLGMTGATGGQVPVVKTVDENGVPTSYEPGAGGGGGGGLPAGGTDGDVLVKSGATDYAAKWERPYSRPNLIVNGYFVGGGSQQGSGQFPINRRGRPQYIGYGYTIDKWQSLNAAPTVALNNDGIVLTGSTNDNGYITQAFPKPLEQGMQITLSLLANGLLYTATGTASDGVSIQLPSGVVAGASLTGVTFFTPRTSTPSETIAAIKLELGSYQTLAHNEGTDWVLSEIPDWNVERYKCNPTIGGNLATIEENPATEAHAVNEYIVYNGQLYVVTTAIASGNTITDKIRAETVVDAIHNSRRVVKTTLTLTQNPNVQPYTYYGGFNVFPLLQSGEIVIGALANDADGRPSPCAVNEDLDFVTVVALEATVNLTVTIAKNISVTEV